MTCENACNILMKSLINENSINNILKIVKVVVLVMLMIMKMTIMNDNDHDDDNHGDVQDILEGTPGGGQLLRIQILTTPRMTMMTMMMVMKTMMMRMMTIDK